MAQDNEVDTEALQEEEAAAGAGRSPLKWILIGLAVLLLAAGGYLGFILFTGESTAKVPEAPPLEQTTVQADQKAAGGAMFAMQTFVVNLSDKGGKRYLKTKFELEYTQDAVRDELNERLPQVRDVVLLLLSSKQLDEIQGIEGKLALKSELIIQINRVLKAGKIKNLYFTEFVVQ